MEIKSRGIELQVTDTATGKQVGDLIVTNSGLVWCRGKTTRQKGQAISWKKFITMMEP